LRRHSPQVDNHLTSIAKTLISVLKIKPRSECRWDLVSLGEVLLRFDPGDERLHTARSFRVWEGGGEYNVARALARCFRMQAAIVTALADNQIGRLVEDLIMQGGVDRTNILWRPTDGISRSSRNGIYFMERGFGPRPPTGCSDRGHTAVSQIKPGEIDWKDVFENNGARWFHTGGIFAGLSDSTADAAEEAMIAAKASGTIVSYDLNYRSSLWAGRGGLEGANAVNRRMLRHADLAFGIEGFDPSLAGFSTDAFRSAAESMAESHPGLGVLATTLRDIPSASRHNLSAACFFGGEVVKAKDHLGVEVLDRVGSGDAFAAGIIYGLLSTEPIQHCVDLAASSAVLAMTTPGDGSAATLDEIEQFDKGSDRKASR
jgi:2-dehydro-3-deoxygluconokinase